MVDGLSVSLQLVARRLEEEKVLMMADVVLRSLQSFSIPNSLRSNL
jgi:amidase